MFTGVVNADLNLNPYKSTLGKIFAVGGIIEGIRVRKLSPASSSLISKKLLTQSIAEISRRSY